MGIFDLLVDARIREWQERLRVFLSNSGLKYTEQRWAIARLILASTGQHMDAQSLFRRVKDVYPDIGVATVYRNLKVLCEAGLLEESHQRTDGTVLYELPHHEHHDHIICLDCGEILEFSDDKIESLQTQIAKRMGFTLETHRHVIHGHCEFLKKREAKT